MTDAKTNAKTNAMTLGAGWELEVAIKLGAMVISRSRLVVALCLKRKDLLLTQWGDWPLWDFGAPKCELGAAAVFGKSAICHPILYQLARRHVSHALNQRGSKMCPQKGRVS